MKLKLRAWDKTNKCWIEEFGITSKGEYLCWDNGYVVIPNGHRQKNIEIMQYTGLNDKNGKEICCGDIVKIDGDKLYIGEIKWQVMGFIVVWNDGQTKSHLPEYCEVIGNIYQDSHLLRGAR